MSKKQRLGLFAVTAFVLLFVSQLLFRIQPSMAAPDSLKLPEGFKLQVFGTARMPDGEQLPGARFMTFGPDGHLYVSTARHGKVLMLPDRDKDGLADEVVVVAENLRNPQGLAFVDGKLLVANEDAVVRLEQKDADWPASGVTTLIPNLPAGGHSTKTLRLGPDGYLYLNVGSTCNVCLEQDPNRATLHRYTRDGKPAGALTTLGRHAQSPIWARGLRNSQGFAWHPVSGEMFATNNGADNRSETRNGPVNDELPPEHLNLIEGGKHYGWPHCWGDQFTDPNFPGSAGFCATTTPPAITFRAHSTPLGISFLDKANFPKQYQSDAVVALHGSWNRYQPYGYKLVRVRFENNRPVAVEDFVTGWQNGSEVWGRPVDVVVGPDGALYVSDDRTGAIYRITYAA
ncbi:PQQ-dependent sugar dehydrogenase [Methylobacillus flagellatus]|uniref:PQQ-dependent sugar dehydrogenase n=1 Tax=Methylobacillus flagellatus TaxID=405 RepID=UPI0010F8E660|nr:PQQ-dependent sugar dehydrogenase [Methylobacillus flagellatus]